VKKLKRLERVGRFFWRVWIEGDFDFLKRDCVFGNVFGV